MPTRPANEDTGLRAANARGRQSWREGTGVDGTGLAAHSTTGADGACHPDDVSSAPNAHRNRLSVRAENVLKELATELTGEQPPRGKWFPSADLLCKLSFRHLLVARNCGPQTTDEILRWAKSQGVTIRRPFYAGKSLSAMWRDIVARSATGQFTTAEIAEALERSLRRKNTRIPVAVQNILVEALGARGK